MSESYRTVVVASRGSALALAQAQIVLDQCRQTFPGLRFELKIIKTTGDKLQTASLARAGTSLPKGLFTKELEIALLKGQADMAVHSLKDLPTELPAGLKLGAVLRRADVRDVLIYRDGAHFAGLACSRSADWVPGQSALRGWQPKLGLEDLPQGAVLGTSSTRRQAQIKALRPDVHVAELRGNVPTRLEKLATRDQLDAIVLALAGLSRLNFQISPDGRLSGDAVPEGLLATVLPLEVMLPCVGQGAIGIEIRSDDERLETLCVRLNHYNTFQAVTAERAFLRAMGGGCQSPVAAYAEAHEDRLHLRAVVYSQRLQRAEAIGSIKHPVELGERVAARLKHPG
ncbi:MAG: hydroxymethylbilane synthase [Verrucomicrobiota bacterium]|nr:hydroxymethylbilane synthase [Limisphaera sp.]MDW8382915.1 hydroxymethylbilane synthase [Verrucomicrobiota bacterium]